MLNATALTSNPPFWSAAFTYSPFTLTVPFLLIDVAVPWSPITPVRKILSTAPLPGVTQTWTIPVVLPARAG